jgi:hypothetical protein
VNMSCCFDLVMLVSIVVSLENNCNCFLMGKLASMKEMSRFYRSLMVKLGSRMVKRGSSFRLRKVMLVSKLEMLESKKVRFRLVK